MVEPGALAGISMTSVPPDVIVPTNAASLDEVTNPINGRRGARRPLPEPLDCETGTTGTTVFAGTTGTCLTRTLDMLGFDVTSGSSDDRLRRVQRATAVVQLDADLPVTGQADDALLHYLDMTSDGAPDARARSDAPDRHLGAREADHGVAPRRRAQDGARRRSDPR